jgi:hypothetical protein
MGTILSGGNEIFQKYGLMPWPKRAGNGLGWEVQGCLKRLRNDTIAGSRRANCGAP